MLLTSCGKPLGQQNSVLKLLQLSNAALRDWEMWSEGFRWKLNERSPRFKTTLSRPEGKKKSTSEINKRREQEVNSIWRSTESSHDSNSRTDADTIPCTCAWTPTTRAVLLCCLRDFFSPPLPRGRWAAGKTTRLWHEITGRLTHQRSAQIWKAFWRTVIGGEMPTLVFPIICRRGGSEGRVGCTFCSRRSEKYERKPGGYAYRVKNKPVNKTTATRERNVASVGWGGGRGGVLAIHSFSATHCWSWVH